MPTVPPLPLPSPSSAPPATAAGWFAVGRRTSARLDLVVVYPAPTDSLAKCTP